MYTAFLSCSKVVFVCVMVDIAPWAARGFNEMIVYVERKNHGFEKRAAGIGMKNTFSGVTGG